MLIQRNTQGRSIADRRQFLRRGRGLAVGSYTFGGFGAQTRSETRPESAKGSAAPAKSCILVYLLGGPPHQDMFDLKPEAPSEIRGPFEPIATTVPGLQICEHLPQLAGIAQSWSLVRSVTQRNSNHTPMIYHTLTGRHTAIPGRDNDVRPPQTDDFPHTGAVLAKFKRSNKSLPGYIALPELAIRSSVSGQYKRSRNPLRGGGPGFLGAAYSALCVNGQPGSPDAIPSLNLPDNMTADRFARRASLLTLLDGGLPRGTETQTIRDLQHQALLLTGTSHQGRQHVFSLDDEPATVRDRYGRHRFGQSLLLARRLTEAGVPMVAIHFNEMTVCDGWDTHSKNFEACREELLPMLDQSLSALLEDLALRSRLDETLVVCLGEFGRTPKINANAGRDHWGECSSALLAGGGIRGGRVVGASDRHAAHPVSDPVEPADLQATLYHCMGLSPRQLIHDQLQRPWEISTGRVVRGLL